jgi:hypothetical protein
VERVHLDPANENRRLPAVRRWSAVVLVTAIAGSAVSAGALAVAASPLHLGSAAASRPPSPAAIRLKVPHPGRRPPGTIINLGGPVVASTGPSPARPEPRSASRREPRSVARDIAHHLAAGNTEVARYAIPYEVYRFTGCRVGFISATVDPSHEQAVQDEKRGRGSRLARARGRLGSDAVAHAAEPTIEGLRVHVIVAQLCPVRRGT